MKEELTRSDSAEKKRVREESDDVLLDSDSPEVKRLRDDLLDVLNNSDPEPVSQDLDSVIKSFENELSSSTEKTQPDLGYLLEASDDELGLPPPPSIPIQKEEKTTEILTDFAASSGIDEVWGFEDQGCLDFGFGVGEGEDFVAVEGLFEFAAEDYFDSGDLFSWRPESLPAE